MTDTFQHSLATVLYPVVTVYPVVTALVSPPPHVVKCESLAFIADVVIHLHMAAVNIHSSDITRCQLDNCRTLLASVVL
jgi:hypothetical protein